MGNKLDLSEMTFDQQLQATNGHIEGFDISPNRRISSELILEPMGTGVRITARDADHRILWGFVGSKDTLRQIHCPVATYETLQALLGEELEKRGLYSPPSEDTQAAAMRALDSLDKTIAWLRKSVITIKATPATHERNRTIARIVSDANQQIVQEANTLRGMKSKADSATQNNS